MSEGNSSVYVGAWINYSKGQIVGSTLTIPSRYGNILISVLALLVGWAGSHFWGVAAFSLHQLRSSSEERDAFHHQQQAILRSRLTDTTSLYRFLEIGWAWRAHTRGSFRRTCALVLIATLNISVFLVAGAFSSRVTSTDGEVLARGHCGLVDDRAAKDFSTWTEEDWVYGDAIFLSAYNGYRRYSSYAKSCYSTHTDSGSALCNTLTVPAIQSKIDREARCPFQEGTCPMGSMKIDSGLISSDAHLGINAPKKDQVQVRKTFTCAPIPVDGTYATQWTQESKTSREIYLPLSPPNDTFKYFYFGTSLLYANYGYGIPVSDYTYVTSNTSMSLVSQPYTFELRGSFPHRSNESSFIPVPQFHRDDADVSILLLNKALAYTGEVKDPWFRAQVRGPSSLGINETWLPSETTSGVACIEQYQFCNTTHCSAPSGLYEHDYLSPPPGLDFNANQLATYKLFWKFLSYMRLDYTLRILKNEILLANQRVYGGFRISSALPNNQWEIEMENLFNISMAGLQLNAQSHATPYNSEIRPGAHLHQFILPPSTLEQKRICNNQKVRSSLYASFNILGLALIISLSSLIILLNLSLPRLAGWFQRRLGKCEISRLGWIDDDILQTQRIALQGKGIGPWDGKRDAVPVTVEYGMKIPRAVESPRLHWRSDEMFKPLSGMESDKWSNRV